MVCCLSWYLTITVDMLSSELTSLQFVLFQPYTQCKPICQSVIMQKHVLLFKQSNSNDVKSPAFSRASIEQSGTNLNYCDLSKHGRNVKVKAIGIVHNYIMLANCWNHDQMSMSNVSMSYGVHKKVFLTHARYCQYIPMYSTNHVYLHRFSRLEFAFAFKTQNAPWLSRFKRVLFTDRFQFAF